MSYCLIETFTCASFQKIIQDPGLYKDLLMLANVFLLTQNSVEGGQDMLTATNESIEVNRHNGAGSSVPK